MHEGWHGLGWVGAHVRVRVRVHVHVRVRVHVRAHFYLHRLPLVCLPMVVMTSWICTASSRVGASTNTCTLTVCGFTASNAMTAKTQVLPVPDFACACVQSIK